VATTRRTFSGSAIGGAKAESRSRSAKVAVYTAAAGDHTTDRVDPGDGFRRGHRSQVAALNDPCYVGNPDTEPRAGERYMDRMIGQRTWRPRPGCSDTRCGTSGLGPFRTRGDPDRVPALRARSSRTTWQGNGAITIAAILAGMRVAGFATRASASGDLGRAARRGGDSADPDPRSNDRRREGSPRDEADVTLLWSLTSQGCGRRHERTCSDFQEPYAGRRAEVTMGEDARTAA